MLTNFAGKSRGDPQSSSRGKNQVLRELEDSLIDEHSLFAIGTDGNDLDGEPDDLSQDVEIGPGFFREILDLAQGSDVFFPSGELAENRFGLGQIQDVAGEFLGPIAINLISFADADFVQVAQYVEQHDRQTVDAADPGAVACRHSVEPSAASGASGDRTVFVPRLADVLSNFVIEFTGERSSPDPRGVGFSHTDHAGDGPFRDAAAGMDAATGTV